MIVGCFFCGRVFDDELFHACRPASWPGHPSEPPDVLTSAPAGQLVAVPRVDPPLGAGPHRTLRAALAGSTPIRSRAVLFQL